MDNKLKKYKLANGMVVDGGRITLTTSTNFCAIISLEGDTRLEPNSVQLSRDFIGRTQAEIGDLLYLDVGKNWAVSKSGWEELEAQDPAVVVALNDNSEKALNAAQEAISHGLALREENVAAREVAVGEAEGRLALRETALVEGETALQAKVEAWQQQVQGVEAVQQRNIKLIAEREEALAAREAAVVEAEAEIAKAKAAQSEQQDGAKGAKSIKVTGA